MLPHMLHQLDQLCFPVDLPVSLLEVEQTIDAPRVEDVWQAVNSTLDASLLIESMRPGSTVAVGVGSRGIANLPLIVRGVCSRLQQAGLKPFIFPCMGSHGGATADGQRALLAGLGVTESSSGCEIRATMDVVEVGQLTDGPILYQDLNAAQADYTFLINRIKPHTDFRNVLESGLTKMCVIGMGKHHGASLMHLYGAEGFRRFLAPAARIYEDNSNLIGGVAVLENAYNETAAIIALSAAEIGTFQEEQLLATARSLMAHLPFSEIDILVVRHIGKDISGTGMDTNIIGRLMIPRSREPEDGPDIAIIAGLDISPQSHGNAAGIGLLNVTTTRLAKKINWIATYTNAVTAGIFGMQRVSLPITMPNDRQALEVALLGCGKPREEARWVFIENTLALTRFWVSSNLAAAVNNSSRLQAVGESSLTFRTDGAMLSPWDFGVVH